MNNKNVSLTTINLFGKREVECILHSRLIQEQEIKAASEVELLKAYGSIDAVLEDITILEIFREANGDLVIYFHTKVTEKVRYYGTDGHIYRFKYGISPDVIKNPLGLGEPNIVKVTCKELGISQKELALFDNKVIVAKSILQKSATDDLADRFALVLAEDIEKIETEKDVRDWLENKMMSQNIVKATCRELGITYKELGDEIGYSESAISNASRGTVSDAMKKAIELYLKTLEQGKELQKLTALRITLKSILE